ncbi:MAG: hypothetical protein KAH38_03960 [Candidatus Hydrogenedentes bacterium]|nr:hypothetical protein [Candidatus Hydrogenedentota bacterium]
MSWKNVLLSVVCAGGTLLLLAGCPPNAMHILTLTVSPAGTGQIEVTPQRSAYLAGTEVTLEAIPLEGWVFQNWIATGLNTTSNPAVLRVYDDNAITAVFRYNLDPIDPDTPGTVVLDGGFELGSDSPHWTYLSGTNMPVICNATICGTFDGLGAAGGAHWAWFGNDPNFGFESATLNQRIFVPEHTEAQLYFNVAVPAAQVPFQFQVFMNDDLLFELTEAAEADYSQYRYEVVDITGLASNANATLRFVYYNTGAALPGSQSAVFVDDISITRF